MRWCAQWAWTLNLCAHFHMHFNLNSETFRAFPHALQPRQADGKLTPPPSFPYPALHWVPFGNTQSTMFQNRDPNPTVCAVPHALQPRPAQGLRPSRGRSGNPSNPSRQETKLFWVVRCRVNSAHTRQSRPDCGLDLSYFSGENPSNVVSSLNREQLPISVQ